MGKKKPASRPLRVVLDTNVLVSALLFARGELIWLREAWQTGALTPLASQATIDELVRVLSYPKFGLDQQDIEELLGLYVPYAEPVLIESATQALVPRCKDPDDQKFLDLAYSANAAAVVTGDRALLQLANEAPFPILTPAEFRKALPQ